MYDRKKQRSIVSTIATDATFEPEAEGGNSQGVGNSDWSIERKGVKERRKGWEAERSWEEKTSTEAEAVTKVSEGEAERYVNGSIKHRQMQRYEYTYVSFERKSKTLRGNFVNDRNVSVCGICARKPCVVG